MVQQQALRDYAQAMAYYFNGTHRKPTWRKAGRNEGFRVVAVKQEHVQRLSRKVGTVLVPKVGWVRFRWSRAVPKAKSHRVVLDRAGRWYIAFAAVPPRGAGPQNSTIVGIDRGVAVSVALSTGELLCIPRLSPHRQRRMRLLQRSLARAKRGSARRKKVKSAVARLKTREVDVRKDWVEKTSTNLVRRFDTIRVENLRIRDMTRSAKGTISQPGRNVQAKAGLNREILASGWGLLVHRLEQKAPGRIEKINPAFTSQRCSACGYVAAENRKSQAVFVCVACGFSCHADVNAAVNIAAGHAVPARGRSPVGERMNREPQLTLP